MEKLDILFAVLVCVLVVVDIIAITYMYTKGKTLEKKKYLSTKLFINFFNILFLIMSDFAVIHWSFVDHDYLVFWIIIDVTYLIYTIESIVNFRRLYIKYKSVINQ